MNQRFFMPIDQGEMQLCDEKCRIMESLAIRQRDAGKDIKPSPEQEHRLSVIDQALGQKPSSPEKG